MTPIIHKRPPKLNSCSQAGQDVFAYEVTGRKQSGSFLDIGCHHATLSNNSWALEQIGWPGIISDIECHHESVSQRKATFIQGDARTLDWARIIGQPEWIDFLSLDVDAASADALFKLLNLHVSFGVICAEHDAYSDGGERRGRMLEILRLKGYNIICPDVHVIFPDKPVSFEVWACHDAYLPNAKRFICEGRMWNEILQDML